MPKLQPSRIYSSSLKSRSEVSLSAFSFLFSEFVQYSRSRVKHGNELEERLDSAGYLVGVRMLELLSYRDRATKRDLKLLHVLSFISTNLWRCLFGKQADAVENVDENKNQYMILDKDLIVNHYISVPKDMGDLNCGTYVAGIVRGVLEGTGFPARVVVYSYEVVGSNPMTRILMDFKEEVALREQN